MDLRKLKNRNNILITGAAGTIGGALIKILAEKNSSDNIVYALDNNESALFNLTRAYSNFRNLKFIYGDVRDRDTIFPIMSQVSECIHCAASKHVALAEIGPNEAISNNVDGLKALISAAQQSPTLEKFLFTSSDKAVNPTNIMGITKLLGERMVLAANNDEGGTRFSATRFGNVLGSNGSVLQVFQGQLKQKRPLTVTHEEMTRFVMSESQAAHLVLRSLDQMLGGELFITKMPAIRILDLAHSMLAISLNRSPSEIELKNRITITNASKGEKLYEELMTEEELSRAVDYEDYFLVFSEVDKRDAYIKSKGKNNFNTVRAYNSKYEKLLTNDEIVAFLKQQGLV